MTFPKKIILTFKGETSEINSEELLKAKSSIVSIIDSGYKSLLTDEIAVKIGGLGLTTTQPAFAFLTYQATDVLYTLSMSNFLRIGSNNNFIKEWNNDNATHSQDQYVVDNHEYNKLLIAWHKVINDINLSSVFKNWIKDKTFNLFIGKKIVKNIKPGEKFDDKDFLEPKKMPAVEQKIKFQISNIEALFVQTILNLNF